MENTVNRATQMQTWAWHYYLCSYGPFASFMLLVMRESITCTGTYAFALSAPLVSDRLSYALLCGLPH